MTDEAGLVTTTTTDPTTHRTPSSVRLALSASRDLPSASWRSALSSPVWELFDARRRSVSFHRSPITRVNGGKRSIGVEVVVVAAAAIVVVAVGQGMPRFHEVE